MAVGTQPTIHLSTVIGGSPEYAPNIEWKISDRLFLPQVFLNAKRTKKGILRPNILLDGMGNPVTINSYQYTIRVRDDGTNTVIQNMDLLIAMLGKTVYLVDSIHCDDGEDHRPFTQTMYFDQFPEGFKVDQQALAFYYTRISLIDNSLS